MNILRLKEYIGAAVGLLYLASGLLKVMDPVGTGLIVEAYFRFMHLPESALVAKILGVVLGALETVSDLQLCSVCGQGLPGGL